MHFFLAIVALVVISYNGVDAIVDGKRLDITESPSTVTIRHRLLLNSTDGLICGGSIISKRHILTAAHCFGNNPTDPRNPRNINWLRVVAGESFFPSDAITYRIEKVYIHPNFTGNLLDYINDRADIAVVRLKNEIPNSPTQSPIDLASNEPSSHNQAMVVGWGYTNPKSKSNSHIMKGLMLRVFDFESCDIISLRMSFVRDEMCVIAQPGATFCQGDSGGPLIVDGQLAGVLSNGMGCDSPEPGVVINVAYHKSWIEDAVNGTAISKDFAF